MEVGITVKNQYQVVEHIGRGGMADVWSARDQRLNRLVAIKTISSSLSTDVDPVALFEQEAQTIAQMEHPHILPIYDFGEYRDSLYIVMRYVTGGSLEDKLEERPLTLLETLQIGENIAKALDYAHQNNVIHLDLKPPNILMDSSGSPYLADFGLATVLDKQGRAQNPGSGTLLYMAPEQLTAEVIDHRADIYSFSIMIFHMLTSTLPFDGMVPLAIKQLQFREELPDLEQFNDDIPFQITDILRQGTAVEAPQRQTSLTQIISQMRDALKASTIDLDVTWGAEGFESEFDLDSAITVSLEDAGLLEAADIYARAKHVWSGGNGRFLLGVSHFMMMCDYYIDAKMHGLEVDELGKQMLLRGALEYDYQVEYWWSQVNNETRRWVCLHTIRSESAPARIRALYHLETLPDDSQTSVIPKLVATALSIETNKDAKIAALNVLGSRAHLLKPSQSFDIKTQFRGRLLSTTTRLGIEILPPKVWQEAVYSPEIDLLIAKEALDDEEDEEVAELAARIIGRIHSLTSLRAIATAQRQNLPHALRALALIRDEAPYLPDVVSRQARLYAWIANTIRRITDHPMQLVFRFFLALLGGAIGFGQHVYITYRSQALFVPQRWGNTLAVGLLMGLFIAILVMFSDALITRLKGFWPNWLRLICSITFGLLLGTLTWTGFTWLYLNQPPNWDLMRMGGFGLAFGLIATTMFNLKSWQSLIVTTVTIFLSIFAAYYNNCTQLYICFNDTNFNLVEGVTNFSISPIVVVGFLFGAMFGMFIPRSDPMPGSPPAPPYGMTQYGGVGVLLILGLGGSVLAYQHVLSQASVNWDYVVLLFSIPALLSAVAMFILEGIPRILYFVLGLIAYGFLMIQVQDTLTTVETLIAPQFGADYIDPLFAYDLYWQALSVALPVSLVIAFGAFAMGLVSDLRQLIGEASEEKDRNAWLTGMLIYVMTISAMVAVLSLFSLHAQPLWILEGKFLGLINYTIYDSVLWAIGGSIIGGVTFTCALATWQWKRWGAYGLVMCAVILVLVGFLADLRHVIATTNAGNFPELFNAQSVIIWGAWAAITGVMTIGVLRRRLWSAFSLVVMVFLWFVISLFVNGLGDSLLAFSLIHVPLIVYAIRFDWELFEGRSRKVKEKHEEVTPTAEPASPSDEEEVDNELVEEVQNLSTELDPNPAIASAGDLQTELDLNSPELNVVDMSTEIDANPQTVSAGDLKTELDLNEALVDAGNMATELDPNPEFPPAGDISTELDPNPEFPSAGDLKTELDVQNNFES